MIPYCVGHSFKSIFERGPAGCLADRTYLDQTGFVEKPLSVSTSEGGKQRNLWAHCPPVSISAVRFAPQRIDSPALLGCIIWLLQQLLGKPDPAQHFFLGAQKWGNGSGAWASSLGMQRQHHMDLHGPPLEFSGCGICPGRASDLGSSRQTRPRSLMRQVRCVCYSEQ